ncbi:RagB/SusD family nutrient uptake outer membrane protein [Flavobacterium cellulosilyticum]|uniref:RagB/SusD family nutrient uptake outer membrane protein n=1 Tax=Flavobacterium cellulosilyticum TaxID=2541731 RepID=A0A4R5C9P7_9FLAO|nr:RagB/SusD family nutrient uptake outer membrane protein [Flavobacterium cellulosilyticum]TDD96631.1 RagB/SusD family nutrient uptake outer membrane protein [Flavobacterium cellulosilyticum]
MKLNLSKYIQFFVLTIILSSCTQDFLDRAPQSELAAGSLTTAADAESILNGAYNAVPDYFTYSNFFTTEAISDNTYVNGDNAVEQPLENFTFTSSNGELQLSWQELYKHITAANTAIDNVKPINDPKWDGTKRKEQIIAEATFLRAHAYYWLVTSWGDVPLILNATNDGNYYPSRTSASLVYAQIITDLKYVETTLDDLPYHGDKGRATKGAARALLAKTYAQMGDYANCLLYCNKVISGPYTLVTDYSKLFGLANKNTTESIFELQVPSNGSPYNVWKLNVLSYGPNDNWPKRQIGSYDLVKAFNNAGDNGARYKSTFNWQVSGAAFTMPLNAWDTSKAIPFCGKFSYSDTWTNGDNLVMIRLSDIILLAAEANVQLDHLAEAKALLNQIRNRAGLANTTAITKSELAIAVLKERRLELVYERTRWNDLKRADANGVINMVNLMNSQVNSSLQNLNYNMQAFHKLLPIPLADIQKNSNILPQNTGY